MHFDDNTHEVKDPENDSELLEISLCSFKEHEGRVKEVYSSVHNSLSIHLAQYDGPSRERGGRNERIDKLGDDDDEEDDDDNDDDGGGKELLLPLDNLLVYFESESKFIHGIIEASSFII